MSDGASPFAFVDGALDRADPLRSDPDRLQALWPRARPRHRGVIGQG